MKDYPGRPDVTEACDYPTWGGIVRERAITLPWSSNLSGCDQGSLLLRKSLATAIGGEIGAP